MLKYLIAANNMIQNYLAYRVNFIFWRLQMFISFVIFYYLWYSVSLGQTQVGDYRLPQLYSYFAIGYIIRALVYATRTADRGGEIQNGDLSNRLLKPMGVIKYYFSLDLVDKIFNLSLMFLEFGLILLFFHPQLVVPTPSDLFYFLIVLVLAVGLFFCYSLIISLLTFWSDQAWSSRFLLGVVFVNLFSGQFVPLNLLPRWLQTILDYTPFPYTYYYPIRIYLGLSTPPQIFRIILITILNLLFYYFLAQLLWQQGIKKYQSYGR
jgi:ABC-2 type transport system permease protein